VGIWFGIFGVLFEVWAVLVVFSIFYVCGCWVLVMLVVGCSCCVSFRVFRSWLCFGGVLVLFGWVFCFWCGGSAGLGWWRGLFLGGVVFGLVGLWWLVGLVIGFVLGVVVCVLGWGGIFGVCGLAERFCGLFYWGMGRGGLVIRLAFFGWGCLACLGGVRVGCACVFCGDVIRCVAVFLFGRVCVCCGGFWRVDGGCLCVAGVGVLWGVGCFWGWCGWVVSVGCWVGHFGVGGIGGGDCVAWFGFVWLGGASVLVFGVGWGGVGEVLGLLGWGGVGW